MQKIVKNIDAMHPDYQRFLSRWQMAWDFWRGGLHVLAPEAFVQSTRFWLAAEQSVSADTIDPEGSPREQSGPEWHVSSIKSYLFKHAKERAYEFEERRARQTSYNLFQNIIATYGGEVGRVGLVYDSDPPGDQWSEILADVDGLGTNFRIFLNDCFVLASVFSRCHILFDRDRYSESDVKSRQDEIALGVRSRAIVYTPLDIVDWHHDSAGRLVWLKIRERVEVDRNADSVASYIDQYRVYSPGRWDLYARAEESGEGVWIDGGDSILADGIPLISLVLTREGQRPIWGAETPFADALDLTRDLLNRRSEADEQERSQSFATLAWPSDDGVGVMEIGPFRCVKTTPSGQPTYISAPSELLQSKVQRIEAEYNMGRQLFGLGRGRADQSREERSADAIQLESVDRYAHLETWLSMFKDFANRMLQQFSLLDGLPPLKADIPALKGYGRNRRMLPAEVRQAIALYQDLLQQPYLAEADRSRLYGRLMEMLDSYNEILFLQ